MTLPTDERTIYDLVGSALVSQHSYNIVGLTLHFHQDVARLRVLLGESATDLDVRRHPICVLYADRLAALTGAEVGLRHQRALQWCQHMQLSHQQLPLPQDDN